MTPPRYQLQRTLIFDLEREEQLAWIEPAVWLPVGTVIEFGEPNRDAVVVGCRLQLYPGDAMVLVDVNIPEAEVGRIPRSVADQGLNDRS